MVVSHGAYFAPGPSYSQSITYDRENLANVHIGIPHRNSPYRDDIQLLYIGGGILSGYYSSQNELGITPMKFDNAFFCTRTGQMATEKTSPSTPEERLSLSGTKLRAMLAAGEVPPDYVTRPEVAKVLMNAMALAPR